MEKTKKSGLGTGNLFGNGKHFGNRYYKCKGRIFYLDQGGAPLSAKCPVCNGSGRVKVQSKVITRIEPFVPGEDDTELMTM